MQKDILAIEGLCKSFPGVKALDNVCLNVRKGEVHALVGENGAGKSTLIKIVSGVQSLDSGKILYKGHQLNVVDPLSAQKNGISVVHQELNLAENLNAVENIFLGRPYITRRLGIEFIDFRTMKKKAAELLKSLNMELDLKEPVQNFSVAKKQIVEIAKAISYESDIIFFDEPSATLTDKELKMLFNIIEHLKNNGVSIVYISHRLEEVFEIADRVTVLRDGKNVITSEIKDITKEQLIYYMVGREICCTVPKVSTFPNEDVLLVKGICNEKLNDVSFTLRKGEILGISGLVGSGRTELARAIYGADKIKSGVISVNGYEPGIKNVRDAISKGIALIPEERKSEGLILDMSVRENVTLTDLKKLFPGLFIKRKAEKQVCDEIIQRLRIVTPGSEQTVKNLSGGNQQKVVLGKWLIKNMNILIFDEPTRGIDVGAKQEIYKLLNSMADQGRSIIIISSELSEIIGMCRRVLIMHDGKITGELADQEVTQEEIMKYAIS